MPEIELPAAEAADLARDEAVIERGIQTFYEVGTALADIRDRELYRVQHGSFEVYCQQRWQMSRSRAYQMIEAASTVSTMVDTAVPVTSERQARELSRVPEPERAEVWAATLERTDGKPTAAAVRETYEARSESVNRGIAYVQAQRHAERVERQNTPADADLLAGEDWTPATEEPPHSYTSPERAPDRQPRIDVARIVLVALTELRQARESLLALTAAHLARQDEETRSIWAARLNAELEALTDFHNTLTKENNQ